MYHATGAGKVVNNAELGRIELTNFDIDGATLKPEHKNGLKNEVMPRLISGKGITIQGLTDRTGSVSHNTDLAAKRIKSVIAYLRQVHPPGFAYKDIIISGEAAATAAGMKDDTRSDAFRAVYILLSDTPTPPPPDPPKPKPNPHPKPQPNPKPGPKPSPQPTPTPVPPPVPPPQLPVLASQLAFRTFADEETEELNPWDTDKPDADLEDYAKTLRALFGGSADYGDEVENKRLKVLVPESHRVVTIWIHEKYRISQEVYGIQIYRDTDVRYDWGVPQSTITVNFKKDMVAYGRMSPTTERSQMISREKAAKNPIYTPPRP